MFRRCNNPTDRYEGGINVRMYERKVAKGVKPGGATLSLPGQGKCDMISIEYDNNDNKKVVN